MAPAGSGVGIADRAPDFSLPGTDGTLQGRRTYSLHAYIGQPVVLVFYPADASPLCTEQLTSYASDIDRFSGLGAQVLALSPQSVPEHESFARAHGGFGFPLLADERKSVGQAYGILGPLGFYRRSVFILDSDHIIQYAHRSVAGLSFRPPEELLEVLAGL